MPHRLQIVISCCPRFPWQVVDSLVSSSWVPSCGLLRIRFYVCYRNTKISWYYRWSRFQPRSVELIAVVWKISELLCALASFSILVNRVFRLQVKMSPHNLWSCTGLGHTSGSTPWIRQRISNIFFYTQIMNGVSIFIFSLHTRTDIRSRADDVRTIF